MVNGWTLNVIPLFVCIVFYSISALFVRKWWFPFVYSLLIIAFLLVTILAMLTLLCRIHIDKFKRRQNKEIIHLPFTMYTSGFVLSCFVIIGFGIFLPVFKVALYGCDKDPANTPRIIELITNVHLDWLISLFIFVAIIYITQRSHYKCEDKEKDSMLGLGDIVYILVSFVLDLLLVRFIICKGKFIIEQQCKRMSLIWQPHSIIHDYFCPDVLSRLTTHDYICNTTILMEEQHTWYMLHNGLLKSILTTCTVELMPVMMALHWLTSGKMPIKKSSNAMEDGTKFDNYSYNDDSELQPLIKKFKKKSKKISHPKERDVNLPMMNISLGWVVIPINFAHMALTIFYMMFVFLNYMHDTLSLNFYRNLNTSLWPDHPDPLGLETYSVNAHSILWLGLTVPNLILLFLLYFNWVGKIPKNCHNSHLEDEFNWDYYILLSAMWLSIFFGSFTALLQLITMSGICKKKTFFYAFCINILYYAPFLIGRFFEVLIIRKLMILDKKYLYKYRRLAPFVSIAGMLFDMTMFWNVYIAIDLQKHKIMDFIEYFSVNSYLIMWQELCRCAYNICLNLFFFSSMLCWIELLMRFHENKFFILGYRESSEEDTQNEEPHQLAIDQNTTIPTSSNNLNHQNYEAI